MRYIRHFIDKPNKNLRYEHNWIWTTQAILTAREVIRVQTARCGAITRYW